jgi:hypothetical protein
MDKPWEHYAKWNKPVPEEQILHDSTYMRCLKAKQWWLPWNRGKEKGSKDLLCNTVLLINIILYF